MSVTITDEARGDVLVVVLQGRLDGSTSKSLDVHVAQRIAAGRRRIALDLGGVDYVSSFGLRVILVIAKKLAAPGHRFAVVGLVPDVRRVFDISGFSSILTLRDTVEDAMPHLAG